MWSIGVIAFVMLSGRPPFNGRYAGFAEKFSLRVLSLTSLHTCCIFRSDDETIFRKIRQGRYKMNRLWDEVSENAKDFVRCLLVRDREQRWTADMALEHPWLN